MRALERIGDYHALWSWLVLSAPDGFKSFDGQPADQDKSLREAFSDLRNGFHFVRTRVKDERLLRILEEMLEISLEAYLAGDKKRGAHALQECESLIWSSKARLKSKYVVEAELRAFGELELFKGIRVSIYPYEGTSDDLSANQRRLLDHAYAQSMRRINDARDFSWFSWALDNEGKVRRLSVEPKNDQTEQFGPLQKSRRAAISRLQGLALEGQITSSVFVSALFPLASGLLTFSLEDKGHARVEAIQGLKINDQGVREFRPMRYHLNDPLIFDEARESGSPEAV